MDRPRVAVIRPVPPPHPYGGGRAGVTVSVLPESPMKHPPAPRMTQPQPRPPLRVVHPQAGHTTVLVTQPRPQVMRERAWNSGLYECCDDCDICLCVTCCPCCASAQLLGDLGENMCLPCCVINWDVALRVKIRTQLGIMGSIIDDCCVTTLCGPCAMCQMMREVKQAKHEGKL